MKDISYSLLIYLTILPSLSFCQPVQLFVGERGPHHRVINKVTSVVIPDGRTIIRTNFYIEVATGMHYWEENQWKDSQDEIEIFDGSAIARHGPHQVIFAANLNSTGAIDLLAPDGKRFRSHVLGLAYTDAATGESVLIAQVRDCNGAVLPPNQVYYLDAFEGDCRADVRYTYTKAGFEQDVILLVAPPSPAQWGMDPNTTRLEIWTEFVEAPEPVVRQVILNTELDPVKRQGMFEPDLVDEELDFGVMKMGSGYAFPLGDSGSFDNFSIPTAKSWEQIGQRRFLIEKVEYGSILPHLEELPQAAAANLNQRINVNRPQPPDRQLAGIPPPAPTGQRGVWKQDQFARVDSSRKGFVLDYSTVNGSLTNFVFQGDTTYLISGWVYLYQNTIIEGGTVVKYTNNVSNTPRIVFEGPVDCRTSPWHPAIFSAKDDDTLGESITGSTGNPTTNRYAYIALQFSDPATAFLLHDIRVRYAVSALGIESANSVELRNAQLGFGDKGIYSLGGTFKGRNILFHNFTNYAFYGGPNSAEHGTFHRIKTFCSSAPALTNCLLISVTNNVSWTGSTDNVKTNLDDTGVFLTVGSGARYLAGDTYRDLGTVNIDAALLSDLRSRTTYAPIHLTNWITCDTTLSRQVQRDTDVPDLGYHYDPADAVLHGVIVTNAALTLERGLALGTYGASGEYGLLLENGASLTAHGSATDPVRIFRYNMVQEQSNTNWSSSSVGASVQTPAWAVATHPTAYFCFTEWSLAAAQGNHLLAGFEDIPVISFVDGQFYGGQIYSEYPGMAFTNCLLHRVNVELGAVSGDFYNNTVYGGTIAVDSWFGTYNLHNNLCDTSNLVQNADLTASHNGYITNQTRWTPTNGPDVILLSANYDPGPLGRFYLPTNSLLTNNGSGLAGAFGLYHFTTDATNQVKETNSTVDVGFHYVALDITTGLPSDSDSDGLFDHWEDRNGNGVCDAGDGETDWQTYDSALGVGGGPGLKVFTPLKTN